MEQLLLINNKKPYQTDLKLVESNKFNIRCNGVELNFIFDKFLEFDYPQQWSNYGDGSNFFRIDYSVLNEFTLTKNINSKEILIGIFIEDESTNTKYFVFDSQLESSMKENISNVFKEICDVLTKYNLKYEFYPNLYNPIELKEYQSLSSVEE